jgi:ureidoglycolate dehydrogenase (NAD+)
MSVSISAGELQAYASGVLQSCGVPPADADTVAECLIYANLSGVDSHGIIRLPHYVRRLTNGTITAAPEITFDRVKPALVHVSGGDGLGHTVTKRAIEHGYEICREQGVVTLAIADSSHFGMAGYYLRDIAREGFVGLVTTHTDVRIVPEGARKPFAGTNPLAIGFPTGGEPLTLDFATTSVSFGKIALARTEGRSIPADWGLDKDGEPTTDPHKLEGMHAIAGYKGSGLAMVIDLFCSMFTGMPYGPNINRMYEELDRPRELGHFVTLWDIGALFPIAEIRARMDAYIEELHSLPRKDPDVPIYYPGEPEALRRNEREANGIPLEPGLMAELAELAKARSVRFPG